MRQVKKESRPNTDTGVSGPLQEGIQNDVRTLIEDLGRPAPERPPGELPTIAHTHTHTQGAAMMMRSKQSRPTGRNLLHESNPRKQARIDRALIELSVWNKTRQRTTTATANKHLNNTIARQRRKQPPPAPNPLSSAS